MRPRHLNLVFSALTAATLLVAGCGGGSHSNPTSANAVTGSLTGTAATGAAITYSTVSLKDSSGSTKTATTGADGKYSVDVTGMTAPILLKVSTASSTLYSVASSTGTANIHPFTDLIVRNWYKANNSDVETVFGSSGVPSSVPSSADISAIGSTVEGVLSSYLASAGISASSFDFITTSFNADGTGFDGLLDRSTVSINSTTGEVTVLEEDPETGISNTAMSTTISTDFRKSDDQSPESPSSLVAIPAGSGSIVLAWNASSDNMGVAGYNVYRGGIKIGTSAYPIYTDTGLTVSSQYCYQIEAYDGSGHASARSSQACATASNSTDAVAPETASGLTATADGSSEVNLTWTASVSTDVVGYYVYRGGAKVGAVTSKSFKDSHLTASTQYCYAVAAFDAAGNNSAQTSQTCATTSAAQSSGSGSGNDDGNSNSHNDTESNEGGENHSESHNG